jgi:hypothetical protein
VGKVPNKVSNDWPAVFPAEVARQFLRVLEFNGSDVRMLIEVFLALEEGLADVVA